jgi:hypothetical protein
VVCIFDIEPKGFEGYVFEWLDVPEDRESEEKEKCR